eukprot:1149728-Amphidinium_carterae.1
MACPRRNACCAAQLRCTLARQVSDLVMIRDRPKYMSTKEQSTSSNSSSEDRNSAAEKTCMRRVIRHQVLVQASRSRKLTAVAGLVVDYTLTIPQEATF